MAEKKLITVIKYYIFMLIILQIAFTKADVTYGKIILFLMFIINNQLRFFSLEKEYQKIISFSLEIVFIALIYHLMGGYLIAYLILAAIDSNTLFDNTVRNIMNVAILLEGIYFSVNQSFEFIFINVGLIIVIIAILYLVGNVNIRRLQAQKLYDKLRISEDKLKEANKELEMYASSIEEMTLLRERNRISREIHDSVGHALSTIAIQLGAIERIAEKDPETTRDISRDLRKFTQNSLNDVRKAVREIKPKDYNNYEGIIAIEELINNFKKLTGVDVRLSFTKDKWPLNSDQSFILYRIVQEFLSNSVRHGKADSILIFMAFNEYKLVVTLKDNGIGAANIVEGIGIKGMRERVTEIGGYFEYSTKLEEGFSVKIELDKNEKLRIHSSSDKPSVDTVSSN